MPTDTKHLTLPLFIRVFTVTRPTGANQSLKPTLCAWNLFGFQCLAGIGGGRSAAAFRMVTVYDGDNMDKNIKHLESPPISPYFQVVI